MFGDAARPPKRLFDKFLGKAFGSAIGIGLHAEPFANQLVYVL
jgi:hypothetical protein